MAYDEDLEHRIRAALQGQGGVSEKRMFGGLGFLIEGHLAVAASGRGLLLRADPARTGELACRPHAGRAVMAGRELAGWLRIAPEALKTTDDLESWVEIGVSYARSLPPK